MINQFTRVLYIYTNKNNTIGVTKNTDNKRRKTKYHSNSRPKYNRSVVKDTPKTMKCTQYTMVVKKFRSIPTKLQENCMFNIKYNQFIQEMVETDYETSKYSKHVGENIHNSNNQITHKRKFLEFAEG